MLKRVYWTQWRFFRSNCYWRRWCSSWRYFKYWRSCCCFRRQHLHYTVPDMLQRNVDVKLPSCRPTDGTQTHGQWQMSPSARNHWQWKIIGVKSVPDGPTAWIWTQWGSWYLLQMVSLIKIWKYSNSIHDYIFRQVFRCFYVQIHAMGFHQQHRVWNIQAPGGRLDWGMPKLSMRKSWSS